MIFFIILTLTLLQLTYKLKHRSDIISLSTLFSLWHVLILHLPPHISYPPTPRKFMTKDTDKLFNKSFLLLCLFLPQFPSSTESPPANYPEIEPNSLSLLDTTLNGWFTPSLPPVFLPLLHRQAVFEGVDDLMNEFAIRWRGPPNPVTGVSAEAIIEEKRKVMIIFFGFFFLEARDTTWVSGTRDKVSKNFTVIRWASSVHPQVHISLFLWFCYINSVS